MTLEEAERAHSTQKAWWAAPFRDLNLILYARFSRGTFSFPFPRRCPTSRMVSPSLCLVGKSQLPLSTNPQEKFQNPRWHLCTQRPESCPSLGHLLLPHPPVPLSMWWLLGLSFLTSPPGPALQAESVPKLDLCISHRVLPLKSLWC